MGDYAQKIRDLRTDHDMTQAQNAEILGTTKNQVGKFERGEQESSLRFLRILVAECSQHGTLSGKRGFDVVPGERIYSCNGCLSNVMMVPASHLF